MSLDFKHCENDSHKLTRYDTVSHLSAYASLERLVHDVWTSVNQTHEEYKRELAIADDKVKRLQEECKYVPYPSSSFYLLCLHL